MDKAKRQYSTQQVVDLFKQVDIEAAKQLIIPSEMDQFSHMTTQQSQDPLGQADYAKIFEELRRFSNYHHVSSNWIFLTYTEPTRQKRYA